MPKYRFVEVCEVIRLRACVFEIEADTLAEAEQKYLDDNWLDVQDSWLIGDEDFNTDWSRSTLVREGEDPRKIADRLNDAVGEIYAGSRGAGYLTRDQIDEIVTGGKEDDNADPR